MILAKMVMPIVVVIVGQGAVMPIAWGRPLRVACMHPLINIVNSLLGFRVVLARLFERDQLPVFFACGTYAFPVRVMVLAAFFGHGVGARSQGCELVTLINHHGLVAFFTYQYPRKRGYWGF